MRARSLAALCASAALLFAPSASAEVFHVDDDAPPGSTTCTQALPCDTLGEALTASANATGPHRINVAAGLYVEPNWFFIDPDHTGLELVGAGRGSDPERDTVLRGGLSLGNNVDPVQTDMTVRNLRVESASSTVNAAGSEITDVAFVSPNPASTNQVLSLRAPGQLLERVSISGGPESSGIYTQESSPSTTDTDWTLRDVTVVAGIRGGIEARDDETGRLLLQRTRVTVPPTAMENPLRSQGPMRVESSLIAGGAAAAIVAFGSDTDPTIFRNVTVDAGQPGVADPPVNTPEGSVPISLSGEGGTVTVQSSVLLEPVATTGVLRCDNSNVRSVGGAGGQCAPGTRGNTTSTPAQLFARPGTDWRLRAGSPAIDAGVAGGLVAGESPFDLAGAPRIVDGNRLGGARRDQGAYEAATPPPVKPRPPVTPARDRTRPRVRSARFRPRLFRAGSNSTPVAAVRGEAPVGSKLRFRLSEPAGVRIRIERALKGRRSGRRCRRPTAKLRAKRRCTRWKKRVTLRRANLEAGEVALTFTGRIRGRALKHGRYRARVVATDKAGNRSPVKAAGFRIVR